MKAMHMIEELDEVHPAANGVAVADDPEAEPLAVAEQAIDQPAS